VNSLDNADFKTKVGFNSSGFLAFAKLETGGSSNELLSDFSF
jgi:hypothetical protein